MAKHELDKGNNLRHADMKWEKPTKHQSYPNNHRQLRNAESKRNSLFQGQAHQTVSPENTHISNIYTEQMYLYI